MPIDRYISQYPAEIQAQVKGLIDKQALGTFLRKRYPSNHVICNDKALKPYVQNLKNQYMKKSAPLSKVVFDNKIHVLNNALGLHKYVTRVQGGKLKSKNEILVAAVFKRVPEAFLNMIVVHELAHLKEKEHNKAFYQLCEHMLPDYHQLEFDVRLYLIQLELEGPLY